VRAALLFSLVLAGCNREALAPIAPDLAMTSGADLAPPVPNCASYQYLPIPIDSLELADPAPPVAGAALRVRARVTMRDRCDLLPQLTTSQLNDTFDLFINAWRGEPGGCGTPSSVSFVATISTVGVAPHVTVRDGDGNGHAALAVDLQPAPNIDCSNMQSTGGPCMGDCQCGWNGWGFDLCMRGKAGSVCTTPCNEDSDCGGGRQRCFVEGDPIFSCAPAAFGCQCDHPCPFDTTCNGCLCVPSLTETICADCPAGLILDRDGCVQPCIHDDDCDGRYGNYCSTDHRCESVD
jgi:hypothetical protein